MSLGSEVKSRMGTGIFLTMYSHTTSMLYSSWAEMGMMGAPSATVPAGKDSSTGQRSEHQSPVGRTGLKMQTANAVWFGPYV